MGKNRKSNGNSGSTSSQDDTNPEYKDTIDTILNDQNNQLNKDELTYLLDNMLSDKIKYDKISKNGYVIFREENGPVIAVHPETLRNMMTEMGGVGLDDVMSYYNSIPEFRRSLAKSLTIGDAKLNIMGGMYNKWTRGVSISQGVFQKHPSRKSNGVEYIMEHEFAHVLDDAIGGAWGNATINSPKFVEMLKTNKGSAYSETYRKDDDQTLLAAETLAEAVAVTRVARKHGGTNAYVDNPDIPREVQTKDTPPINYNTWKKNNPELAEFAGKLVDCKNQNECKSLFREYGL